MNKKQVLKLMSIILGILIVFLALFTYVKLNNINMLTGVYFTADNTHYIVHEGSPIKIVDNDKNVFSDLSNGDKILLLYRDSSELYPSQIEPSLIFKTSEGSQNDIPSEIINQLVDTSDWWE